MSCSGPQSEFLEDKVARRMKGTTSYKRQTEPGIVPADRELKAYLRNRFRGTSHFGAQKILAILCRANSTSITKDLGEVLRGFEATGQGHVKYTRIGNTQHCLGTLNPQAQNKLMRGFPC